MSNFDHPHPFVQEFQYRIGRQLREREAAVLAELVDKKMQEKVLDNSGPEL